MMPRSMLCVCSRALLASVLALGACQSTGGTQSASASTRRPEEAQRLCDLATPLLSSDPAQAEHLLNQALVADLFHGPSHNNLGVLYLSSEPSRLYEAAQQFEWARKLMPGNPEPRVNLAMTLEQAGQAQDAMACYRSALESAPEHVPALQGLARLQIRSGSADHTTHRSLETIAVQGTNEHWREWARKQLALGH